MSIPPEVREVLRLQLRAVERASPEHVARLLEVSQQAVRDLERDLVSFGSDALEAQLTRSALLQAQVIADGLAARHAGLVVDVLEDLGRVAAGTGRELLVREVAAWAKSAPGAIRPMSRLTLANDVLSDGLLEYYQASRDFYGLDTIARMRQVLSTSAVAGDTFADTVKKLTDSVKISPLRAERIVRTEHSFALHQRQVSDMEREAEATGIEWRKELSATFDDRTGKDSKDLHGQQRKLDEPFHDKSRDLKYMHPPNRPNDREVVLFVPVLD